AVSEGDAIITASAEDSDNNIGADTITVSVYDPALPTVPVWIPQASVAAGTAGNSLNATAFTPPANCLLVVAGAAAAADPVALGLSGGSRTWTRRALGSQDIGAGAGTTAIWTAEVGETPPSVTLALTHAGTSNHRA